jgi:hypothetical protein
LLKRREEKRREEKRAPGELFSLPANKYLFLASLGIDICKTSTLKAFLREIKEYPSKC